VTEIELGDAAQCRDEQPGGEHDRSKQNDAANADPAGEPPGRDAADGGADQDQRSGRGRRRARRAQVGRNRRKRNDRDQRRAVRDRQDGERRAGGNPGGAAVRFSKM
jgi:hypothetical protein